MALLARPGKVPGAAPVMAARATLGVAGVALLARPVKVPGVGPARTGVGRNARGLSNAGSYRRGPPRAPRQDTRSGAGVDRRGTGCTGTEQCRESLGWPSLRALALPGSSVSRRGPHGGCFPAQSSWPRSGAGTAHCWRRSGRWRGRGGDGMHTPPARCAPCGPWPGGRHSMWA